MKNRDYKEFSQGNVYHIYNRGNNKDKIFFDEQDYRFFLFRIGLALGIKPEELQENDMTSVPQSRIRVTPSKISDFKLHAFCLMPNHFHLLIEQCGDEPISKLMLKINTSYVMYINKKYKRIGHLFQDQFKSVTIENDPQLMWVSSYIHMNPIKDKLARDPSKYKWSSYNDYLRNRNLSIVYRELLESVFIDLDNFKKETLALSSKPLL